jgi:hypothetical protein
MATSNSSMLQRRLFYAKAIHNDSAGDTGEDRHRSVMIFDSPTYWRDENDETEEENDEDEEPPPPPAFGADEQQQQQQQLAMERTMEALSRRQVSQIIAQTIPDEAQHHVELGHVVMMGGGGAAAALPPAAMARARARRRNREAQQERHNDNNHDNDNNDDANRAMQNQFFEAMDAFRQRAGDGEAAAAGEQQQQPPNQNDENSENGPQQNPENNNNNNNNNARGLAQALEEAFRHAMEQGNANNENANNNNPNEHENNPNNEINDRQQQPDAVVEVVMGVHGPDGPVEMPMPPARMRMHVSTAGNQPNNQNPANNANDNNANDNNNNNNIPGDDVASAIDQAMRRVVQAANAADEQNANNANNANDNDNHAHQPQPPPPNHNNNNNNDDDPAAVAARVADAIMAAMNGGGPPPPDNNNNGNQNNNDNNENDAAAATASVADAIVAAMNGGPPPPLNNNDHGNHNNENDAAAAAASVADAIMAAMNGGPPPPNNNDNDNHNNNGPAAAGPREGNNDNNNNGPPPPPMGMFPPMGMGNLPPGMEAAMAGGGINFTMRGGNGEAQFGFGAIPVEVPDNNNNNASSRPKWSLAKLQKKLLQKFSQTATTLTMDALEGSWDLLSPHEWTQVCQTLAASLPNITCLRIDYAEHVSDGHWAILLQHFSSITRLEIIHMGDFPETCRTMGAVLASTLQELSLQDEPYAARTSAVGLSSECCTNLATSLKQLVHLRRLTIQNLIVQDVSPCWKPLLVTIRSLPTIAQLQINGGWHKKQTIGQERGGAAPPIPRVTCRRIPLSAHNLERLQYGPRICAAKELYWNGKKGDALALEDWIHAIVAVRDRIDCVYYFISEMDPNMFAKPALEAALAAAAASATAAATAPPQEEQDGEAIMVEA